MIAQTFASHPAFQHDPPSTTMMSERVHPETAEPPAVGDAHLPESAESPSSSSASAQNFHPRTPPKPGSYVIQVPKDQIYRVPPPENAHRYAAYTRRRASGGRSRRCSRCVCWSLFVLVLLAVAAGVAAAVLFLVFRPKAPNYSIDSLSVSGLNLSGSRGSLSPEFDVAVRANNPNEKVSIYYRDGSYISVSYNGVSLARGAWPTFHQPPDNVTVFRTALKESGLMISSATRQDLVAGQNRGAVPLLLDLKVPVRIKFGSVASWTVTAKVQCDLTVDKLTASAKITSKSCRVKFKI